MGHPLIDRLTRELGWPCLSTEDDVMGFIARPGVHVLFVVAGALLSPHNPDKGLFTVLFFGVCAGVFATTLHRKLRPRRLASSGPPRGGVPLRASGKDVPPVRADHLAGVALGALFLIVCGLIPKIGAIISSIPIEVLGGGVIVMFGMVVAAGGSMLSDVNWNRRNMVIFAIALSLGLGLQLEPNALQYLPGTLKVLATSGILPAAVIAIVLNLVLPEELSDEATEEVSGGMAGHGLGSIEQDDHV